MSNDVDPQHDSSTRLVVFSDDWGRHPSSCQHLITQLLDRYDVIWVNTIGTRSPKFSLEDAGKAFAKLRQWFSPPAAGGRLPDRLRVVTPRMYPGFRHHWQRAVNARMIAGAVNRALRENAGRYDRTIAVTTLPVTADLVGRLHVDRWVYYCVDDFSVWPGLDGSIMDRMERSQTSRIDAAVAVSNTLRERLAEMGLEYVPLLTHGIDLKHWGFDESGDERTPDTASETTLPDWWQALPTPRSLFWGVVDRRLDSEWCQAIAAQCGTLVLAGPQQSPDPALMDDPRICLPGPMPYDSLPGLAAAADVLVMPYADLPVTRAMQPLKFKEYLATGRPAVVRELPATRAWSDAADVVSDCDDAVRLINERIAHGVPDPQRAARRRLRDESWRAKAEAFEKILLGGTKQPRP